MKEKKNTDKGIIRIILISILAIQVIVLFFVFTFLKQGYHSDEVWNYGFANSFVRKDLCSENNGESLMNKWLDSNNFLEYISVEKEHRFSYITNIRNATNDLNPPFQYMVLHTVSSFFPGVFSWYFCFFINTVSFIVSQIFIFKLTSRITNNKIAGLAAVILYGFGVGAMDITIYMRIYALAVMFATIFAYCSHRIYETRDEKLNVKYLIPLFFSCFLGAYTLHVFLMVAFVITLCYTLYFLFSKHFKVFFVHGFTCLAAALLSLALVPKTFEHVGGVNESHTFSDVSYPFLMDLRLYLYSFTKDLFGIHVLSYANVYFEVFLVVLGFIIIMLIPIYFLIRKEKWFVSYVGKGKDKIKNIFDRRKGFQYSLFVLFVTIVVTLLVVVKWTSYFYMGEYSNRYIFIFYPLAVVFAVGTAYLILQLFIENKKIVVSLILSLCVVLSVITHFMPGNRAYFFEHEEDGVTFKDLDSNARCVIVLWEDWILICFAPELYQTDEYYATTYFDYKNSNVFKEADLSKDYYLIIDQHYILPDDVTYEDIKEDLFYSAAGENLYTEDDFLAFYRNLDEVKAVEYAGKDSQFGREFKIYKVMF